MLITKLGEFGLIERLRKSIRLDRSVIKGTGDDCAVLKLDKRNYQLFTCDMIVEGVDFTHKDSPYHIGRKAIYVSVSDIASCCGTPKHCVVSMGIPPQTKLNFVDKILSGILSGVRKYGINLVGGDISKSKELVIDVAMLGIVPKSKLVLRSGAKPKDIIFVTGSLGGAISGKHLSFTPRLKEAEYLSDKFKINSMIDISDGLIADLGHILKESEVGALLYKESVPLHKDARSLDDALYTGDDYELLFTLSRRDARMLLHMDNRSFKPIGEIMPGSFGLKMLDKYGSYIKIKNEGYRHF